GGPQAAAASAAYLQALARSQLCRQARRHCRPLCRSAGPRRRALARREEPDPGPRPHPTGVTDQARTLSDHDPRLQTLWHHHPVRRPQRARRTGDRSLHAAPPPQRIHPFPQGRRASGARRQADPCGARQLCHPQTSQEPALAKAGVLAWLARHPRWTFHFTPTSASWLNAGENFFSKMTRQRIRRGAFRSIVDLQTAINAYLAEHNASPKPFLWTKSAEAIMAKLQRCPVPSV